MAMWGMKREEWGPKTIQVGHQVREDDSPTTAVAVEKETEIENIWKLFNILKCYREVKENKIFWI